MHSLEAPHLEYKSVPKQYTMYVTKLMCAVTTHGQLRMLWSNQASIFTFSTPI